MVHLNPRGFILVFACLLSLSSCAKWKEWVEPLFSGGSASNEETLVASLAANPNAEEAYFQYIVMLVNQSRFADARTIYQKYMDHFPGSTLGEKTVSFIKDMEVVTDKGGRDAKMFEFSMAVMQETAGRSGALKVPKNEKTAADAPRSLTIDSITLPPEKGEISVVGEAPTDAPIEVIAPEKVTQISEQLKAESEMKNKLAEQYQTSKFTWVGMSGPELNRLGYIQKIWGLKLNKYAYELFNEMIAEYPDSPSWPVKYLIALLNDKEIAMAQKIVDRALRKFPNRPELMVIKQSLGTTTNLSPEQQMAEIQKMVSTVSQVEEILKVQAGS